MKSCSSSNPKREAQTPTTLLIILLSRAVNSLFQSQAGSPNPYNDKNLSPEDAKLFVPIPSGKPKPLQPWIFIAHGNGDVSSNPKREAQTPTTATPLEYH